MQKRLAIMHEVARIKWNQNLPIEDLPREQQLLVQLTKQGQAHGMDGDWIYTFFQVQFDAAKMIQHNDFAIWSAQEKVTFEAVLDLKQEIRPYLDQISIELIEALAKLKTEMKENSLSPFILPTVLSNRTCDYINNKIWQTAIFPLKNLEK